MTRKAYRIEQDTLGSVRVPIGALYGAQTQRAIDNFQISGWRFPRVFIRSLALIKRCAAEVNGELGLIDGALATAIATAAREVEEGSHDTHFPIDIFQTGSGTSANMNANEVIAHLASQRAGYAVHPNDHVNLSQSSNDVIPSAIHISAAVEITQRLVPSLQHLVDTINQKALDVGDLVVTGRTHLMDAVPLRLDQEFSGWTHQVDRDIEALQSTLPRLCELALGGTAVGTGLNAPAEFGERVAARISAASGLSFVKGRNLFALLSSQDTAVETSGQLRTLAVSLTKIANDLRWMNSGPLAGIGEITLPALQPGSSIMPGKVNPVIPEAVAMACAQVVGNDMTIALAGQAGNFQLNVMLPVITHNLLLSVHLLTTASAALADKAIAGLAVNERRIATALERNLILVTALVPHVGYDVSADIARRAQSENRSIRDVATELTDLSDAELDRLLDVRVIVGNSVKQDE